MEADTKEMGFCYCYINFFVIVGTIGNLNTMGWDCIKDTNYALNNVKPYDRYLNQFSLLNQLDNLWVCSYFFQVSNKVFFDKLTTRDYMEYPLEVLMLGYFLNETFFLSVTGGLLKTISIRFGFHCRLSWCGIGMNHKSICYNAVIPFDVNIPFSVAVHPVTRVALRQDYAARYQMLNIVSTYSISFFNWDINFLDMF